MSPILVEAMTRLAAAYIDAHASEPPALAQAAVACHQRFGEPPAQARRT
jgi:hypothetical protein